MHVIVTGGSSGIGLAIAKLYAIRGDRVSLLARHPGRLEEARVEIATMAGVDLSCIQIASVDVASAKQVLEAVEACERAFGPCDVLIASAGIVEPSAFDIMPAVVFDEQIATNLLGTANIVRAVYKGMKTRRSGKIMMISSGAALIGIYGYTAYCASKSALIGFAEALSAEAAIAGVRVAICFPPDTLTPQYHREMSMRPAEAELLMGTVKPWSAEAVAAKIVGGLDRGKARIHFGWSLTALAYFGPLIKPLLIWWYSRKLRKIIEQGRDGSLARSIDKGFDRG
ncbi:MULTISPECIES: SDR family oxidoreductase [unclassified Rhizobium]|uniref:SDR family oxidoreductase n=1 Tax=unclassified Rhizobium TaxID=2613769 RepID=UPI000CDF4404|nr:MULTISPECIES: SDR family oxidoreductase [Rhizobium]AVA21104.1 short-chain dehydrogenase/reductase SDR family protein [Rhizobium sp. NXC24]MDK4739246.1 SDR family oxidoreductase [Rhizobium sp. CNPSo 3464]UWU22298.1 SDR family oxidoreductase [Rhizobium tropici]